MARKLGRATDQRMAMLKNQVSMFLWNGRLETTLERAKEVINTEFPEIAKKVTLNIPDEKARRVGQSVAAASLPKIT